MGPIKRLMQYLLSKTINRYRFNDFWLYRYYLELFYPEHAKKKRQEREFYLQAVGGAGATLIFDVGANVGDKTIQFLPFAKQVVSIEPSPAAVEILRSRFSSDSRVIIVPKAVASRTGFAKFYVFSDRDPYNTLSSKWVEQLGRGERRTGKTIESTVDVPIITLDQLIDEYGVPDYIKMDIEGYELEAILGLSRNVRLISLECNLPEFVEETIKAISVLSNRSQSAKFNFCTTEPPVRFESDEWLDRDKMTTIVACDRWRFMEVFCRLS